MTKSAFRRSSIIWLLCLVGVVVVGPLTMALLALAGQCGPAQGLCFFVPLFAIFWGGPIGAAVFSLLLLRTIHRRINAVGMSAAWTFAAFIWLCAAAPMIAFGSFGVIEGASGVVQGKFSGLARLAISSWLVNILFLLTLTSFLGRAETGSMLELNARQRQSYLVASIAAAYVTILLIGHAVSAIERIPFFGIGAILRPISALAWKLHGVVTLGMPSSVIPLFYWIDFAIFSSALAYVITHANSRHTPPGTPSVVQRKASLPGAAPRADFGRRAR